MSTPPSYDAFNAAIERANAIGPLGRPGFEDSWRDIRAYRTEIKQAMQALRNIITSEPDAELRHMHHEQLRCLKRMHYGLIRLEDIAIVKTSRRN